jgi:hypothetical protein
MNRSGKLVLVLLLIVFSMRCWPALAQNYVDNVGGNGSYSTPTPPPTSSQTETTTKKSPDAVQDLLQRLRQQDAQPHTEDKEPRSDNADPQYPVRSLKDRHLQLSKPNIRPVNLSGKSIVAHSTSSGPLSQSTHHIPANPITDKQINTPVSSGNSLVNKIEEAESRFWIADFEYKKKALEHRKKSFENNLFESKLIFWIVLSIVVVGILLSIAHFAVGVWVMARTREKSINEGGEAAINTLELSKDSVKIASPVIGLIILTLSLAFFYFYLKEVYPIKPL